MSIHLHTIQKAVFVPAAALALSLTLAAAPALAQPARAQAQPAATVFASDPVGDCANGAQVPALVGGAAGSFGGPETALLGAAIGGEIGCGVNVATNLSK